MKYRSCLHLIFLYFNFLIFSPLIAQNIEVIIDGEKAYQTIRGWGGNTYSWVLQGWNGWTNPAVYDLAFKQLGTTHVRMVTEFEHWELQNDDNDPNHFNWDYFASRFKGNDLSSLLVQSDFDMMGRIVQEYKDELIVGIWNVPNWMVADSTKKDHRRLLPEMYPEFAESVAAYLLWARDHRGLQIRNIILANEPDGTQLEYTPQELRDLIKIVGAKLQKEGLKIKIVTPDLASPYFDPDAWVTILLEDSLVTSYLGAISYHTYYVSGGPDRWNEQFERIAQLAASRNLEVWFTEVGTTPWNIPNTTWSWAFDCAQMWLNILNHGNASLGYQWALLGKDYAVNPDATLNPIYFVLQQFFEHIPAGSQRIAARSSHPDLLVSAFKHKHSGQAQVVMLNRTQEDQNVLVKLQNLKITHFAVYRTSQNEKHIQQQQMVTNKAMFSITIPAMSIVTLVGDLNSTDSNPPKAPKNVSVKKQ